MFEHIEMRIIGYNVFSIGSHSTVNKFVIISISHNQPKVNIYLLKNGAV